MVIAALISLALLITDKDGRKRKRSTYWVSGSQGLPLRPARVLEAAPLNKHRYAANKERLTCLHHTYVKYSPNVQKA
jgi:hypothetical protein